MTGLLNDLGSRWLSFFAPALVQNTLFLALVLILLHRIRHASARIRYAVGAVGLAKLLLPPFLPLRLGLGTAAAVQQQAEAFTGAIRFVSTGPVAGGGALVPPGGQLGLAGALFAVWVSVVCIYIAVTIVSTARLVLALRGAERVAETPGLPASTHIRVHRSDRIAVPMALGLFPRRIYVPAAWEGWSDECRRMVLRHEAAHIARRDGLVQALQILAQALYFFHPLVLILGRRLAEYREMACDDLSAGGGGCAGVEYSRFLVELAESIVRTPATCESASTLLRKKNELMNRVRYQLKGGAMLSKGRTAILLAMLLLLVLPMSWYHTSAAPVRQEERSVGDRENPPPPPEPAPAAQPAPSAVPAKPAPPKTPPSGSVSVEVSGGGMVVVDGEAVTWAVVGERLRKVVGGDEKKVVKLQCAVETPMERIHRIHEVLRATGLSRIEYRNGTGYGAPLVLPPADVDQRLSEIDAAAKALLLVDASGRLTLDGEPIELSELSTVVAKRIEKTPPTVVILQTELKTNYGDFLDVLKALKDAGAKRIVIQEPAAP